MRLTTKQKYYVLIILVCLLAAVIGLLMWHHKHHTNPMQSAAQTSHHAVIDITPSGFVPASLTVKAGTVILWQNQDSATHKVASNPYPADSSVPGLNSGTILPNGSYRYTPTSAGTIYYHDDTKPTLNGTIMVSK